MKCSSHSYPALMVILPSGKIRSSSRLVLTLLGVLFVSLGWANAQKQLPDRTLTAVDDVVYATCFSPDGRALAIARGGPGFGRIELWETTGRLRHVIRGFDGQLGSVSFSPDGKTLVSSSSEYHREKIQQNARSHEGLLLSELKWWDAQTGELKRKLTLPDSLFLPRVAYSPDGTQLMVSQSLSGYYSVPNGPPEYSPTTGFEVRPRYWRAFTPNVNLKLLDAQTGEMKLKLKIGRSRLAAFSPDGTLLAFDDNHEIQLWNRQTKRIENTLKGFNGFLTTFAFSPSGQFLAAVITRYRNESSGNLIKTIANSEVRIFDARTWKLALQIANLGAINSVAFGRADRVLIVGGLINEKDGYVPGMRLCDLQTGSSAVFPSGDEGLSNAVDSVVVAQNGELLAFQSGRTTVKMFDTMTGTVVRTFDEQSAGDEKEGRTSRFVMSVKQVRAVAFLSGGNLVSGELETGEVRVWDHRTGEVKKKLEDDESPSSVAIAANGNALAEVANGALRVWTTDGEVKRRLPLVGGPVSGIAVSADGQTVAAVIGKVITLLNVSSGLVLKTIACQTAPVHLDFSNDGRRLASADEPGLITIWDLASGRVEATINAGAKVTALSFGRDGQTLAAATDDCNIGLWSISTGSLEQRLKKQTATINALDFSPDGKLLASGSDDRTVVIWDTVAGKPSRTLKGHDQTVTSLAFSPDGSLLASGCGNASVVIWDVRKGNLVRVLR